MNGEAFPRLVIAGLSGDAGKTFVSIGVALAARAAGCRVRAFKKGPDYIDAAWLRWASDDVVRNLDTFLMGTAGAVASFFRHALDGRSASAARDEALNLIEGNRGLFDGADVAGTDSTAVLAKALAAPVVLVLNVRKMTRTAAACVRGCQALDPDLALAGVILNQVAGERHESVVRQAIERECGIPVLGAIPRLDDARLPGRHLGLITPAEHPAIEEAGRVALDAVRQHVNVGALIEAARAAGPAECPPQAMWRANDSSRKNAFRDVGAGPTIGYVCDSAFSFYYPENLEALAARGATLVPISSLSGEPLPGHLDALYIGGGFPETHANALSANVSLRTSIRAGAKAGLPIYAECGGLMLLARSVIWQGRRHDMADVLPIDVEVGSRPQGHGYVRLRVDRDNPFFGGGQELRGHEFHYSRIVGAGDRVPGDLPTACAIERGTGCGGGRDGIVVGNVWASYTHLHALGAPAWADGLVAAATKAAGR
ncbi:MAG TPA: cobyrinate a,c-diamide synthase [Vicinamibacterales bacterium]|jgi:cobyrinic acid a,c-diamide synthase